VDLEVVLDGVFVAGDSEDSAAATLVDFDEVGVVGVVPFVGVDFFELFAAVTVDDGAVLEARAGLEALCVGDFNLLVPAGDLFDPAGDLFATVVLLAVVLPPAGLEFEGLLLDLEFVATRVSLAPFSSNSFLASSDLAFSRAAKRAGGRGGQG